MPLLTAGGLSRTEGCEGRWRPRLVCTGELLNAHLCLKAVGEGLHESCDRHRRVEMTS